MGAVLTKIKKALSVLPLPSPTQPQKKAIVASLVVFGLIPLIYYFFDSPMRTKGSKMFAGRDFRLIPFDEYDATHICLKEAEARFGPALLRTHVNDRSTRFQADRGIYIVVLNGHVGTLKHFEEADIYCYVDPEEHLITYYQAVFPERRSLLDRALRFFEDDKKNAKEKKQEKGK